MNFNTLQTNNSFYSVDTAKYSLTPFSGTENFEKIQKRYEKLFNKKSVKNISFCGDGFFTFFLSLKGKIAVSLGESEAIVNGALKAKEFGVDIEFISINKDGSLNLDLIDSSFTYVFISSYIMDTYVKTDLQLIKEKTDAKIISNATVEFSKISDIYVFDSYKLCGLGGMGVLIYDDEFEQSELSNINLLTLDLTLKAFENKKMNLEVKQKFLEEFKKQFNDELYLFVDPSTTLEYTLHIGLKSIKARELIRTMAFENIYITNGEGCSLGLSRPSRIIEQMGYSENEARWGLSLDFSEKLSDERIENIVDTILKRYKQIKVLG